MIRDLFVEFLTRTFEELRVARTEDDGFLVDLRACLAWLKDGKRAVPRNALMESFAEVLTGEFAATLDARPHVPAHAFGASVIERYEPQRIAREAQSFLSALRDAQPVIVQSAVDPEPEAKARMRAEAQGNGFVSFLNDRTLLGGLRMYRNGKMTDASWLARVKRLLNYV